MEEDEEDEEDEAEEEAEEEDEEGGAEPGAPSAAEKKAAAALSVSVGSFSDPVEAQGLSHFLEHMVFMGSERFPAENEYDSYLQQHGGSSNAYTEAEATVFHLDCAPHAFRGALERLASQFEAPLCAESATQREVRAVDSEFTQAQQSDGARLLQVQCVDAPSNHPAALFSWVRHTPACVVCVANDLTALESCTHRAMPRASWRMWKRVGFRSGSCCWSTTASTTALAA